MNFVAYNYDIGISCPDEQSAFEIYSFFDEYHENLEEYFLSFEYSVKNSSQEWLIRIIPYTDNYEAHPENLIVEEFVPEVRRLMHQVFTQHPQWNYYYAWFGLEIYYDEFTHGQLLSDVLDVLTHQRRSERRYRKSYKGFILQNILAEHMGIAQAFEHFNTNYCWIPYDKF
ncbi:hypothetical protein BKI52_27975 [marine bacterium AO1-C]|nr:hypothetical protein BKI52_27975 [marine bacterium AO1-C]